MDFDWNESPFKVGGSLTREAVEESFEDPFAIKLMPDSNRFSAQVRFFNLGRSLEGLGIFSVCRTNGKQIRVILARIFVEEENYFYERRMALTLK